MTDIIIQNNGEDLSSKMKNNKNGNFSNKNTQKSESNNSDKKINENITDLNSLKSKLKGIKFIDGQFEIEDCIGSGGESKVYILLNHKRKRACSLKVIENIKKERNQYYEKVFKLNHCFGIGNVDSSAGSIGGRRAGAYRLCRASA